MTAKRVLYLEDDAALAETMVDYLEDSGFRVEHAPDGRRGLEKLAAGGFDLVLSDVTMPEVDGWQVLRRIRGDRDRSVASLPVVLLTSHDTRLEVALGRDVLGADAYITKPFDPRLVVTTLVRLTGGGKP